METEVMSSSRLKGSNSEIWLLLFRSFYLKVAQINHFLKPFNNILRTSVSEHEVRRLYSVYFTFSIKHVMVKQKVLKSVMLTSGVIFTLSWLPSLTAVALWMGLTKSNQGVMGVNNLVKNKLPVSLIQHLSSFKDHTFLTSHLKVYRRSHVWLP